MVAVTYGTARTLTSSRATKAQPKGKGFFARLYEAMIEARMQQAYREIGLHRQLSAWEGDVEPVENKELPFGR